MVLDLKATKRANMLTWVGLGRKFIFWFHEEFFHCSLYNKTFLNYNLHFISVMSVQFGVLARLTWWEYSWDVSK